MITFEPLSRGILEKEKLGRSTSMKKATSRKKGEEEEGGRSIKVSSGG